MSSAFVLVPEKWYLERKGETFGHVGDSSALSTREQRSNILSNPNASKLVSIYDRQVHALKPKTTKDSQQQQQEPKEPDREEEISDSLHLAGIRKVRAMQIYKMLMRDRRISISAHDTILIDGVDSNIPIVQFLYDSQTRTRSNMPAPYLLLFRMLNLSNQNITLYKPVASKKRPIVSSTPISRRTRSQKQPRTLFKEEYPEPSREAKIEKLDSSLKSAKEEWSDDDEYYEEDEEEQEEQDSRVEIKPEKTVTWQSHP